MTFHHEVNSQQKEAIRTVEGPVMVVAGPGSGKTRVLTFRIAHLIQIGVPAYQILALTFTNKAANEMRDRIVALVGEKSRQLWMGTFHSVLARILRVECKTLGYDSNFSIYDTTDTLGVIKEVMHETGISAQQYNPQAVRARISAAKNRFLLPDEFAKQAVDLFEEKAARIYAEYQKRLKKNNALDFDDLLIRPIELFQHHKTILHKYQDRFRFILIDEYQDTNHAQYVLIKLLADKSRNICVVGDDAQSIYAFRGADIRNILDFQRDYPDAKIIRLEQNYRSTKTILAAADQVIKHNVDQLSKNLWTENGEGDKITLLTCQDDRDEGATIVSRIYQESLNRKLDLKDFAVMYRTNAQSRALEEAFMQQSVRYVIVGGVRFYERKEIKDVMAYLRLLVNPHDDESFLRIVNVPGRGLGNVAIQRLRSFAGHHSLPLVEASRRAEEISTLLPKAKKGLRELSELLGKYSGMMNEMSASEVSRAFVDEIGILRLYKEEGSPESMARWENVQELLTAITEFSTQQPDATLSTFLQDQALLSDMDQWDDKHNAVTLMTLHSAKGLEFPVVFIAGLEEGLLPFSNSSVPDAKELEEERRLYYVGLTRAMQKLYLSYARVRFRFSELSYQSPSRFIDEIEPALIEGTSNGKGAAEERWTFPSAPIRGRRKVRDADAQYHTDVMPDYDHEQDALKAGSMVMHEIFGKGRVVQVSGSGDALKAVVEFSTAGKKNLLLKYARLRLL